MGAERKRRRLKNIQKEEQDDDVDEEEKMKLFFALIQNTKGMRERIKSKESAKDQEKSKGVWNPKFQPEDFIEDGYEKNKSNITLQLTAASSSTAKQSNEKEEQQQEEDKQKVGEEEKGLDLNLSL